jgi:hypothetical protein
MVSSFVYDRTVDYPMVSILYSLRSTVKSPFNNRANVVDGPDGVGRRWEIHS